MNAHSLSFSVADSAGNLLKTKTLNEFNLLLSRHCLPCEPLVLLFMISSFVKKKGRRLTAHLCLFASFLSASRTRCTFLGVTHVRIMSSATGISTALSTALLELTVLARVAERCRISRSFHCRSSRSFHFRNSRRFQCRSSRSRQMYWKASVDFGAQAFESVYVNHEEAEHLQTNWLIMGLC